MFLVTEWKNCVFLPWAAVQTGRRFFASRSKKIFATTLRHKEGRQLALEHFDFYYKPIFRKRWPSIRLGFMSRSKSCAIINNFGADSAVYRDQFTSNGALDLMKLLEEAKAQRLEKREIDTSRRQSKRVRSTAVEDEPAAEGDGESNIEQEDARSAATLNQFVLPTKFITRDTVPASHKEDEARLPVLGTWSREDVQIIHDDDVAYPKHLRAFVYPIGDIGRFEDPALDENTLVRSHQIMDAAALFPVLALDIRPDETVLDLCAAPGEKTMALLQTLIPCNLVCNDVSPPRINLLRHNLCTYIQQGDEIRSRIRFLRADASHLKSDNIGVYDKVLVDAPNTEDRRNLRLRDDEDNLFRRAMITERLRLPDQQTDILVSGLKALRRDGVLVYTTATLAPSQNDEVIESALRRLEEDPDNDGLEFAVCDLELLAKDFYDAQVLRFARRQCRYGQLVIPFLPNNYGPVYTCKMKRVD